MVLCHRNDSPATFYSPNRTLSWEVFRFQQNVEQPHRDSPAIVSPTPRDTLKEITVPAQSPSAGLTSLCQRGLRPLD